MLTDWKIMTQTTDGKILHLCMVCDRSGFEVKPERLRCPTCNTEKIRPMTEQDHPKGSLLSRLLRRG